ncbi:hypothetical protein KBD08_02655 [Candidatus Babeliales bacterium]|nr:hypothetical protein [Candidatus Babeliales bacterium]
MLYMLPLYCVGVLFSCTLQASALPNSKRSHVNRFFRLHEMRVTLAQRRLAKGDVQGALDLQSKDAQGEADLWKEINTLSRLSNNDNAVKGQGFITSKEDIEQFCAIRDSTIDKKERDRKIREFVLKKKSEAKQE